MTDHKQSSALAACLRGVWWRGQRKHLVSGMLAAGRWVVALFLVAVAIDWLVDLPSWARGLAVVALLGVAIERGWRHGWQQLERFDASHIATVVERHAGGMDSLLVTAEQFARSGATPGTSEAMWALAEQKAEEAAARLKPADMVGFGDLRRPLMAVLALAAVVAAFAAIEGPLLAAGAARLFTPWLAVAYPTKTRIDVEGGDLVVKEGDRASIVARLSGVVPEQAKFLLQTGTGRPREMVVDVADGRCEYELASAARDFTYRIKAGDARTAWHRVRVIPAPRIEAVKVRLEYPPYIGRPSEIVESLTLTVPENTAVRWDLTLDRPVREAVLHRDGEKPLPLEVSEDGRRVVLDEVASASRGYTFSWVEREHGFDFTSPRSYLQVAADQPPRIELAEPAENLHALIGRPLELAIRAQDDHGLGPATVTCRVNQRPEKVIPLEVPIRNGEGEQPLDWDYRKAFPDLEENDTISFVVEVADRYPGEGGPHKARTEARRITFLSRDDYLAEVRKKIDRILSRVRTIYRQERAAHEFVRDLDPRVASFAPSSQLEAVRQEMIREQLQGTAGEVRAIVEDLAANNVADAVEGELLDHLSAELLSIAADEVAPAAKLLREQATVAQASPADVSPAMGKVNAAARRLAVLVLKRGIEAAREVFASESRMLAEEESHLRAGGIEVAATEPLAVHQETVATWTQVMLASLEAGMRRDQRPLATLALARRIKDLRGSGAEQGMRDAAAMLRMGKAPEAATNQAKAILPLLKAEFSVRAGAEYAAILKASSLLDALVSEQQRLRGECEANSSGDSPALAARQLHLLESLARGLLPAVSATRPRLFDEILPTAPPVADVRAATELAMGAALAALRSGDQEAAVGHQQKAEESLRTLRDFLARWVIEFGTVTQGLSTLVVNANDRITRLEEFEARQLGLLEQTEEAAVDGKASDALAEPQRFLVEELTSFRRDIAGKSDSGAPRDMLPLLGRIDRAMAAMTAAGRAIAEKRAEDALEPQEQAADLLAEARELAEAQKTRLGLLQDLLTFQQAVGFAGDSMGDVIAEQRELVTAADGAGEAEIKEILPKVRSLGECLVEVAPVLALVAGRLDAGTPLLFAGSDLEDAIAALEDGDAEDAAEIIDEATESLARVQALVAAVRTQTGYVAEIVEYLHEAEADAANLVFRQGVIRERLGDQPGQVADGLVADQEALRSAAEAYGLELERVTGMQSFTKASGLMAEAVAFLRSGKSADAAACMESAESSLQENAEELFLVITMLHGLPSIEVTTVSPDELRRLLEVLAIASEHRQLSRHTQATAEAELGKRTADERALERRAAAVAEGGEPHPMLTAAVGRLAGATASLEAAAKVEASGHQRAVDDLLRHFVIEQALILETSKKPPSVSPDPVLTETETDDLHQTTADFVSDFVSGEAPKDKRSEWEVLAARDRASLNQNFARELPLEYRATLKNYYERVAK